MEAKEEAALNELVQWLEWFSTQPGADRTSLWISALKSLRREYVDLKVKDILRKEEPLCQR